MKRVYFIRPVGQLGPIKIGCSSDPDKRFRAIEIWSPLPLELIGAVPGEHHHENALHHRFGSSRLHGEWFNHTPELQELIDSALQTGALPPMQLVSEATRTKGVMTKRVSAQTRLRSGIKAAVTRAERRAYGYEDIDFLRPDDVADIFARWAAFSEAKASPAEIAVIDQYVAALRAGPRSDRSFAAWNRWHNARLAGQAA